MNVAPGGPQKENGASYLDIASDTFGPRRPKIWVPYLEIPSNGFGPRKATNLFGPPIWKIQAMNFAPGGPKKLWGPLFGRSK